MKGQEWIGGLFSLLLAGIIAGVALPAILPGQALKVTPEVEANEFENKAILLANSLLTSQSLIHSDNRGVFDEENLNKNMMEKSSNFNTLKDECYSELRSPPLSTYLCISRTYPDSFALVLVKDTENGKGWFSLIQPNKVDLENKLLACFESIDKTKTQDLFDETKDITKILNIEKCGFKRYSTILNELGFVVPIRYSDNGVHIGWMKVLVVE